METKNKLDIEQQDKKDVTIAKETTAKNGATAKLRMIIFMIYGRQDLRYLDNTRRIQVRYVENASIKIIAKAEDIIHGILINANLEFV